MLFSTILRYAFSVSLRVGQTGVGGTKKVAFQAKDLVMGRYTATRRWVDHGFQRQFVFHTQIKNPGHAQVLAMHACVHVCLHAVCVEKIVFWGWGIIQ